MMYRVSQFVQTFAWCLLAGAALATLWVNLAPSAYYDFNELRLFDIALPGGALDGTRTFTPASMTGEVLMALFVLFVGKELWEAVALERGTLRGRRAVVPLLATAGGMTGAVVVYLILAAGFETAQEATRGAGWAVPLGSDVVLAYVTGRLVFGVGHPALRMLLLLTIADDIAGLVLLGLAFPNGGLEPVWLLVPLGAALVAFVLFNWLPRWLDRGNQLRPVSTMIRRRLSVWPYLVAGAVSWVGVAASGLPPSLGLLPVIPAIPHAERAFGVFAEAEEYLSDTLNRLEQVLVWPVAGVLFLFGLTHGGVDLAAFAPTTMIVLGALLLGKPLGVVIFGGILPRRLGVPLPKGIGMRELGLIGLISAIGFTVPLLTLGTALPGGAMADAARTGLGLSLFAVPLALVVARVTGSRVE